MVSINLKKTQNPEPSRIFQETNRGSNTSRLHQKPVDRIGTFGTNQNPLEFSMKPIEV